MKKLKFIYVTAAALAFASCGQNGTKNQESEEQSEVTVTDSASVQTESAEEADTESVTSAPEEEVAEESKKQVSDEDWDAMLSSYERLVDSYIDCMTKYKQAMLPLWPNMHQRCRKLRIIPKNFRSFRVNCRRLS